MTTENTQPKGDGKPELPQANIYWRELPQAYTVRERGSVFVAEHYGLPVAVVYWLGHEASEAQAELARRAKALAELEFITHIDSHK